MFAGGGKALKDKKRGGAVKLPRIRESGGVGVDFAGKPNRVVNVGPTLAGGSHGSLST